MSADAPPLVTRPVAPRPRPGFVEALLLTIGFAAALFGSVILIVLGGFVYAYFADPTGLDPSPGVATGSVAALGPFLADLLAWSFPVGYLAGLGFAATVFRVVAGPGWTRGVGLGRLPPAHLAVGLLALPSFVILSDGLAGLLFRLFRMEHLMNQSGALGDLYRGFHPAFVVLAVGVGPGLVEELWCRGFLGRGFVGRYGWLRGVALASLAFGLLHAYPPPYVVVTAVMGACLHFAYACSRSLWVPIAVHVANNSFAGLAATGFTPTGGMDRAVADRPLLTFALAAVVLLCCGCAAWSGRATCSGPRGVMVPPGGVTDRRPGWLPLAAAAGSATALIGLLAAS